MSEFFSKIVLISCGPSGNTGRVLGLVIGMAQEDTLGRLVELVRGHPCIYDSSNSNYYNKQVKSNVWSEIAETLGPMSNAEARAKWEALKDQFRDKEKRRDEACRSGAGAGWRSNWDLWEAMKFLEPYLGNRQLTENVMISSPSPPATGVDEPFGQSDDIETLTLVPLRHDQLDSSGNLPPTPLGRTPVAAPKRRKRKSSSDASADDRANAIIAAVREVNAIGQPPPPGPETADLKFINSLCEEVARQGEERRQQLKTLLIKFVSFSLPPQSAKDQALDQALLSYISGDVNSQVTAGESFNQ